MANFSVITSCVKYMLFIFNLLFVITGIIIISVGAVVQAEYNEYTILLEPPFRSIPGLLIAIGVLIFIIAFFGCCGAIKENYCMTLTFTVMLIGILILEVAAGISGFVLRDRTEALVERSLMESIKDYNHDNITAPVWDHLQSSFECCGVNNATDWGENKYIDKDQYPMSCCKPKAGAAGMIFCNTNSNNTYTDGCLTSLSNFLSSHAASIGATGVCIGIIQFVGIVFACHLAKKTKYGINIQ